MQRYGVMIPDDAMQTLLDDLVSAVASATSGPWAVGHDCLLSGLRHAESVRDQGVPWGDEWVHRYRQALAAFEQRYGISSAKDPSGGGDE